MIRQRVPKNLPRVCPPDSVRTLRIAEASITFLINGSDTQGAWSLLEYEAPARFAGPAPHWHRRATELFYVLEGALTLRLGGETHTLHPGDFALVPPGTQHSFHNAADAPTRFLVHLSPGGMEAYFMELAEMMREEPIWPPKEMSRLADIGARYDIFLTHPLGT